MLQPGLPHASPRGSVPLSGFACKGASFILWVDKIQFAPLETMKSHCLLVCTGQSSFQGFLGGAGFCPSTLDLIVLRAARTLTEPELAATKLSGAGLRPVVRSVVAHLSSAVLLSKVDFVLIQQIPVTKPNLSIQARSGNHNMFRRSQIRKRLYEAEAMHSPVRPM